MQTILQDLRYALRQFRKSPGLTLTVVMTLALGIGAATAVFSIVDTVLVHTLPYRDPSRLVLVSESLPHQGDDEVGVSAGEFLDYQRQNRSFTQVAAFESDGFNLTGTAQALRVNAAAVSPSTFPLLGASAELGRTFTREEGRAGTAHVVVLSHTLWQDQFSGDRNIVGKIIRLDEQPYTVIGVMAPSFRFPLDGAPLSERASLWVPLIFAPELLQPQNRTMEFGVGLIGRLAPGVTPAQAQQDVTHIANDFMRQYGYSGTLRVAPRVLPFAAYSVRKAKPLVVLLAAAVLCILFIACINVANLMLARASERTREVAVRAAIGASRSRLLVHCLVESALLSLLGGGSGVSLALIIIAGLKQFGPASIPRLHDVALHPVALLFALALSLLTSVCFGFVPAWRLSHVAPQFALKASSNIGPDRSSQRLQSIATTTQIALALTLLIAGGLLLRSFLRLVDAPLGFRPEGTFVVRTLFDHTRYSDSILRVAVQRQMIERLEHLPGVKAVAEASHLPLSNDVRQIGFRPEYAAPDDYHWAENSLVSPGYFQTMGISLLHGRDFNSFDRKDSMPVAIVNETLARRFFPGQDPVGQRFQWGDRDLFTIIGVADDVHIDALDADPQPMVYNDMFQVESGASSRTAFILRSSQPEQALLSAVKQQLGSLDKGLPLYDTTSLSSLVSESLAQRRFTIILIGSFGLAALALAVIGIFGVISNFVVQRSRELGLRMALGAQRSDVLSLILKRGLGLASVGLILGLLASALLTRFLSALLFNTKPLDFLTFASTTVILFAVAVLACVMPAYRASRLDPNETLRQQ